MIESLNREYIEQRHAEYHCELKHKKNLISGFKVLLTAIVILIYSFQPTDIIMSVRNNMNVKFIRLT